MPWGEEVNHEGDCALLRALRNALFPGMAAAVCFLQLGDGEVEVTLGGGEAAVAQDLLNVSQVGFALQQVGGATVPPQVAGDTFLDPGQPRAFFDQVAERVAGNGQPAQRQEQAVGGFHSQQFRTDALDVGFEERARDFGQRHHAVFRALAAVDPQKFLVQVHVGEREEIGRAHV